jgi:acyl-coenzyme A thioesterase PaaI-like protein
VSYLEITRQGELYARATVIRSGKTITFLEAELRDADGGLLATATSTARVISKSQAS